MKLQELTGDQLKVLYALQEDLPAESRPYDALAQRAGRLVEIRDGIVVTDQQAVA